MSVVLKEDCHRTSKISQPQRLDVLAVDEYAPLCGVVDSGNKLENGAFPRSIRTDYNLEHDTEDETGLMPRQYIALVGRTQSWPGKTLKETSRRAYCSLPGYRNETSLWIPDEH